ncbi:MAG: lipid-A-disaccharide synthase [Planctomycetes bacterium]|nr:lipid-A-disaccharide synthase [Planctomycetota bacterium]
MESHALNVLMVAGETSGDIHAASVASEILALRPDIRLWGMGGDHMRSAGVAIERPMRATEVMGTVEVLASLGRIHNAMKRLVDLARSRMPAAAVLTDYSDFNLRFARRLRTLSIPVVYFISPKVWAWRKGRTRTIRQLVDLMLLILPFEEDFYTARGMKNVKYVGNPLVDQLAPILQRDPAAIRSELGLPADEPVIGVLAGSRPREIRRHAAVFVQAALQVASRFGGARVLLAPPDDEKAAILRPLVSSFPVEIHPGKSREVLRVSHCAIVKSGTGTLEAAVLGTPAVVAYRAGFFNSIVGHYLVSTRYFSLPNIIAGSEIYPEIMRGVSAQAIADRLAPLWQGEARDEMLASLREVSLRLGPPGASRRAAEAVVAFIDSKTAT